MRKLWTLTALLCLFVILDNTLVPFFQVEKYYPSLLFVFVICYSIIAGTKEAIVIGSVSGLLQDVFLINGIGINAFANMLLCVFAAEIGKNIFRERAPIPILSTFFLSVLKGAIVFALLYIVHQHTDYKIIVFRALYNMVISIFMYRFVYKLGQREYMKKDWKF